VEEERGMTPYYDDGRCVIYHGDCRDVLPGLGRFDLLLTDPPYGIGEHGGACRTRGRPGYAKHENMGWDHDRPSRDTFDLMLSKADTAIVWGGNYFSDFLPPSMGWIYWRKLMGGDFSDGELAWTSERRALREFTRCPKGMNKEHPTQKPLELIQWCISEYAAESRTVLDPFMGSGTTLRAAKDLNRTAVGVERSERYCEIAARRLSQEVLELGA
jgi:DNA modification methylase